MAARSTARPLVPSAIKLCDNADVTMGLIIGEGLETRSAIGKARGLMLRLSLVLEYLRWCSEEGYAASPTIITEDALLAAAAFVTDYIIPSAQRTYGDATCSGELP
jgi:hypothetical protein